MGGEIRAAMSPPIVDSVFEPQDAPPMLAEILGAHHAGTLDCAAPQDFLLAPPRPVQLDTLPGIFLPYCLDVANRRSIYVGGLTLEAAKGAPFYYLYARRQARQAVLVPWSRGPLYHPAEDPIFLFSAGRCGTTLLTRILFEAGIAAVSEPDFYTQFTAGALFGQEQALYAGAVKTALDNLTNDLAAALAGGDSLVVKLRAEVCFAVKPLLGGKRGKSLFMIRDIAPWARSSLRIFDYAADETLAKYTLALKCLAVQRALGDCHCIRYESLLRQPEQSCAALGRFLGRSIMPEAIRRALARDAQSETPLARGLHPPRPNEEKKLAEILALWNTPKYAPLRQLASAIK